MTAVIAPSTAGREAEVRFGDFIEAARWAKDNLPMSCAAEPFLVPESRVHCEKETIAALLVTTPARKANLKMLRARGTRRLHARHCLRFSRTGSDEDILELLQSQTHTLPSEKQARQTAGRLLGLCAFKRRPHPSPAPVIRSANNGLGCSSAVGAALVSPRDTICCIPYRQDRQRESRTWRF